MALPVLTPAAATSSIILPSASLPSEVSNLPYGMYLSDQYFLTGAADQVAYVYHKLGGDVLDVELTKQQVWAAYEEAVLEYSMIINMHQAKSVMYQMLGAATGSFDSDGQIQSGTTLYGENIALKFPRFSYVAARRMGMAASTEAGYGGDIPIYSASFTTVENQQDYDLQDILSSSSDLSSSLEYYQKVGNKRVNITKVFYKSPHAAWRFFGTYGGINTIGNLSSYGQWADDTTFEVVPVWQNKLQAINYQDSLRVRTSHFAYEIKNNKLRIMPTPFGGYNPGKMWICFFVDQEPWNSQTNQQNGTNGVNNMNTLPFENLPYQNINSIGKHWIRRFCLALCKEMLSLIRGKFATIPIPGDSVTLNSGELSSQAKSEMENLRKELTDNLDKLLYQAQAESAAKQAKDNKDMLGNIPMKIFFG